MRRTEFSGETVHRQALPVSLEPLLQCGFIVLGEGRLGAAAPGLFDQVLKLPLDEAAYLFEAAIEIDRGNQRFVGIRNQRVLVPPAGLLFPPAEDQEIPKPDALTEPGQ